MDCHDVQVNSTFQDQPKRKLTASLAKRRCTFVRCHRAAGNGLPL